MIAPTILFHVIGSPNNQYANSMVNIMVVPLNIYAVDSSIRRMICCHNIAYIPITPTAPANANKYLQDINTCREASLVKIPTVAYMRLVISRNIIDDIFINCSFTPKLLHFPLNCLHKFCRYLSANQLIAVILCDYPQR